MKPKYIEDNPEFDNTDFAHPAFWRGQDDGINGACRVLEKVLDGKDDGGGAIGSKRLEDLRRRLLKLCAPNT